jgi:hypothetical protein
MYEGLDGFSINKGKTRPKPDSLSTSSNKTKKIIGSDIPIA